MTPSDTLEREIIGSIIRDPSLYADARVLSAEDFSSDTHQAIWRQIVRVASQGSVLSPRSIAAGTFDIDAAELDAYGRAATANLDTLRELILRISAAKRRERALASLQNAQRRVAAADNEDWESDVEGVINALSTDSVMRRAAPAAETRHRLERRVSQSLAAQRLPTGLTALDTALRGGLPPSSFTMVGAFGKSGKTSLIATLSYNWEQLGLEHLCFTLERRDDDIEALKAARDLNINALDMLAGGALPPAPATRHCQYVHATNLTADDIRHEILYGVRRRGVRAALIDYWQLIEGRQKGETAAGFRTRVAQTIQKTAIDADIPILMTYQIGAGVDNPEIQAARTAANLCLLMHRDKSDPNTWFETVATNISTEADIGGVGSPAIILDRNCGPHFRNPDDAPNGSIYAGLVP